MRKQNRPQFRERYNSVPAERKLPFLIKDEPSDECVHFRAGRSGVQLPAGPYQDLTKQTGSNETNIFKLSRDATSSL